MTLSQRLSEFRFNLETMDLLSSMGRSSTQTIDEMTQLGLTTNQINFMLTSRSLLNSCLLRLQLYSEQNLSEAKVRSSLGVLNNSNINSLLDNVFYKSETVTPVQKKQTEPLPTFSKEKTLIQNESAEEQLEDEEDDIPQQEVSRFDQFFNACVKQTNEPTDIVKTSDFYTSFSDWWGGIFEESVPDKNELKDFLNNKLGKSNKNTWSNVALA
jgi:hypothetical protein